MPVPMSKGVDLSGLKEEGDICFTIMFFIFFIILKIRDLEKRSYLLNMGSNLRKSVFKDENVAVADLVFL